MKNGSHFYTSSRGREEQRPSINLSATYRYEGIAYYVVLGPVRRRPTIPNCGRPTVAWAAYPTTSTAGPEWIQIGTEGGFLPKPAIIPQQPITWNMDPTMFNVGNVQDHSLLLGSAERADVIVDFSKYAGKTLILYNDAPTAFPALDPRTDYFTGDEDHTDTGGTMSTKAGFGPNTRTVMQIKVAAATPAPAVRPGQAQRTRSRPPTPRTASSRRARTRSTSRTRATTRRTTRPFTADPYVRICQTVTNTFKTVSDGRPSRCTMPLEPKAIQDEKGETFDPEYGRMSGKLGLEMPGTNAANQNFILYSFIDPTTEILQDSMTPLSPVRRGRHADLEDHAQRRRHAPDPLPPLRRAAHQPRRLGRLHPRAGRQRARLEGHRPGQPARGHDRGPQAGCAQAAVRPARQRPAAQPGHPDRLDHGLRQHRPAHRAGHSRLR